jgi:hypothetical protein
MSAPGAADNMAYHPGVSDAPDTSNDDSGRIILNPPPLNEHHTSSIKPTQLCLARSPIFAAHSY